MTTNNKNNPSKNSLSNIEIYQSEDGQADIRVQFDDDSVWLNRHQLAELFDRDVKTVGKHINNVFKEGELDRDAVVAKFATTAEDNKIYQVEHYNLDVIISVGYRVKSKRGTQFRIWTTGRLRDYLLKGYALDKQRFEKNAKELEQALTLIKNPPHPSFKKGGSVLVQFNIHATLARTKSPFFKGGFRGICFNC